MADNKKIGEQIVKRKPRGGNSPVIGDNGMLTEPGDNSKYLTVSMQLANLSEIDLRNAEQVRDRINEYFTIHADNDMKPTVAGLALALGNGITRQTLWAIKTDSYTSSKPYKSALPPQTTDLIKKAYFMMENLWENYMQNGKINPVSGIFLGKNNYGYQDKTEYVITPNNPLGDAENPEDIAKRYALDVGSDDETPKD